MRTTVPPKRFCLNISSPRGKTCSKTTELEISMEKKKEKRRHSYTGQWQYPASTLCQEWAGWGIQTVDVRQKNSWPSTVPHSSAVPEREQNILEVFKKVEVQTKEDNRNVRDSVKNTFVCTCTCTCTTFNNPKFRAHVGPVPNYCHYPYQPCEYNSWRSLNVVHECIIMSVNV